jgi:site-specific DNA recombinase
VTPGNHDAVLVMELEQELSDRLTQQRNRQEAGLEKQNLLEAFASPLCWESIPPEEKKELYRALVQRIVIRDREVVGVELRV